MERIRKKSKEVNGRMLVKFIIRLLHFLIFEKPGQEYKKNDVNFLIQIGIIKKCYQNRPKDKRMRLQLFDNQCVAAKYLQCCSGHMASQRNLPNSY